MLSFTCLFYLPFAQEGVTKANIDILGTILSGGVPMILLLAVAYFIRENRSLNAEIKAGLERERKLEVAYRKEIKDQMQAQIDLNKPMAESMARQTIVMERQESMMKRSNSVMQRVEVVLAVREN